MPNISCATSPMQVTRCAFESSRLGGSNAVPGASVRLLVMSRWGGEYQKSFKINLFRVVNSFTIRLIQSVALKLGYITREERYTDDEVCVR